MLRRDFLLSATALSAGGLLAACERERTTPAVGQRLIERVGLGLFTIPHWLDQDFAGAMKRLAEIGYKEVELFGPYTFSVPEAHARWDPVAEQLGIRQTGLYGHSPAELRAILDAHGLSAPSMHADLGTLQHRLDDLAEAAHTIGVRYAGLPSIAPEDRRDLDGYRRMADTFNEIGARMQELGLIFLYHNHGYGLVEMEGQIPLQVLLERTDKNLVVLEMDVYWTTAGRADPIAYLEAYPDRYRLLHVKDMSERVSFEGDGGDPAQWIGLFSYMADAGSGVLDLPAIVAKARDVGVQHFFLELDLAADPEASLMNSYRFLSSLEA